MIQMCVTVGRDYTPHLMTYPQLHVDRPGYSNNCWCQLCQTLGGIYLTVTIEDTMKKNTRTHCFGLVIRAWQHLNAGNTVGKKSTNTHSIVGKGALNMLLYTTTPNVCMLNVFSMPCTYTQFVPMVCNCMVVVHIQSSYRCHGLSLLGSTDIDLALTSLLWPISPSHRSRVAHVISVYTLP